MNIPSPEMRGALDESLKQAQLSALWLTDPPGGILVHGEKVSVLGLLSEAQEEQIQMLKADFRRKVTVVQTGGPFRVAKKELAATPQHFLDVFRRKDLGGHRPCRHLYWQNELNTTLPYMVFPDDELVSKLYVPDDIFRSRLTEAGEVVRKGGSTYSSVVVPETGARDFRYHQWDNVEASFWSKGIQKGIQKVKDFLPFLPSVSGVDDFDRWEVRPVHIETLEPTMGSVLGRFLPRHSEG